MNQPQIDYANYLELEYGKEIANNYRKLVSSPSYPTQSGYQLPRRKYPSNRKSRKKFIHSKKGGLPIDK